MHRNMKTDYRQTADQMGVIFFVKHNLWFPITTDLKLDINLFCLSNQLTEKLIFSSLILLLQHKKVLLGCTETSICEIHLLELSMLNIICGFIIHVNQ